VFEWGAAGWVGDVGEAGADEPIRASTWRGDNDARLVAESGSVTRNRMTDA
jgi:hypothetical protein